VCLQVKLCDPHLSALEVSFSRRGAIQIYVYVYVFTFTFSFSFAEWLLVQCVMPRLHQDTCHPETCIPDEQLVSGYIYVDGYMSPDTCCLFKILVVCISRRHNYYSFMSRPTCIPLYPATDGRQTGDNFVVADTRNMLTATSGYKWIQLVSGNMYPGDAALLRSNCLLFVVGHFHAAERILVSLYTITNSLLE